MIIKVQDQLTKCLIFMWGKLQFCMNVDGVANVILTSTMLQFLMDVDSVVNMIMTIETFVIFIFVA